MESLTKAKIKIHEIEFSGVYLHPDYREALIKNRNGNPIGFKTDLWRYDPDEDEAIKEDTIHVDVCLEYFAKENTELLIKIEGSTEYKIKPLKRKDVTEVLWEWLVDTSVRHLTAQFIYKYRKDLPEGFMFPRVNLYKHADIKKNTDIIWDI